MIKQQKKEYTMFPKFILAWIILIILLIVGKKVLRGFYYSMHIYGSDIIYITPLYMPYVKFFSYTSTGGLLCIGMIYDVIIRPIKLKKIKEFLRSNEKIPIKIKMISKKNAKKDSDLFQAYIIKWEFINNETPHIKRETIFYSDVPDFMFKYRGKEAYIQYDDKYLYKYKLTLPELF